jgi:hypothetical protein
MKWIFVIGFAIVGIACKTKPFLKHELKFEKTADHCDAMDVNFKMNSNLNGERYEFQRCLDDDFQKEQLTSIMQGDTVLLKFERKNQKQALYKVIVDVDSYPRYNFLNIEGTVIRITPYEN